MLFSSNKNKETKPCFIFSNAIRTRGRRALSASCGVRTHAQLPAVDLKSTPLTSRANWRSMPFTQNTFRLFVQYFLYANTLCACASPRPPPDKPDSIIGVDIRGSSVAPVLGATAWCGLHLCVVLLRRLADGISFRNALGTFNASVG